MRYAVLARTPRYDKLAHHRKYSVSQGHQLCIILKYMYGKLDINKRIIIHVLMSWYGTHYALFFCCVWLPISKSNRKQKRKEWEMA